MWRATTTAIAILTAGCTSTGWELSGDAGVELRAFPESPTRGTSIVASRSSAPTRRDRLKSTCP